MAYTGVYGANNNAANYPLLSSHFDVIVRDHVVDARLYEVYESRNNVNSQINYVFFLPPEAALVDVEAQIGGVPVLVDLREKTEANRLYNQAVRNNETAVKLEQVDANTSLFQIALGNVRPRDSISIRIVYSYLLATDITDDSFRLDVPVGRGLFDPRTPGARPTGANTVFISPNAPAGKDVISIDVRLSMVNSIWDIASPTHNAQTEVYYGFSDPSVKNLPPARRPRRDDTQAYIHFGSKTATPSNFVLTWSVAGGDEAVCSVESFSEAKPGEQPTLAFALKVTSKFKLDDKPPQDFMFLVDCSGSMAGARASTARTAVGHMLDNLTGVSTTFNIFRFTTATASVLPNGRRLRYDRNTAAQGKRLIPASNSINSGGTDLNNAISTALRNKDPNAERTAIIIVTDGLDWDGGKAVATIANAATQARSQNKWVRLFVLGIGDEISRGMCEALARAGAGAAAYIGQTELFSSDHVKQKAERLMRSIDLAPIQVIRVEWPIIPSSAQGNTGQGNQGSIFDSEDDGTNDTGIGPKTKGENLPPPPAIQQAPNPGKLFWALQSTWFAICRGTMIPGRTYANVIVNVSTRGPTNRNTLRVNLYPLTPLPGKAIHPLAAHALIQDFEDKLPSLRNRPDQLYTTEAEIVRLGLRYKVLSSQTTYVTRPRGVGPPLGRFVVLPSQGSNVLGVPSQGSPDAPSSYDSAHGWDNLAINRTAYVPQTQFFAADVAHEVDYAETPSAVEQPSFSADTFSAPPNFNGAASTAGSNSGTGDPLKALLDVQEADGSFSSSRIATLVFPYSAVPALPPALVVLSGPEATKEAIWATILTVLHLEKQYAGDGPRWRQAKANADQFVSSRLSTIFGINNTQSTIDQLRTSGELYVD